MHTEPVIIARYLSALEHNVTIHIAYDGDVQKITYNGGNVDLYLLLDNNHFDSVYEENDY